MEEGKRIGGDCSNLGEKLVAGAREIVRKLGMALQFKRSLRLGGGRGGREMEYLDFGGDTVRGKARSSL